MRALRTVLAGGAIAIASIVLWGAIPEEMLAQDAAPSLAGNEVLKVLGEDVVGAPESAPPLNDPGRVARWEPGEWRYRVMTGSRKGQTEQESLEPIGTTARGESWKRTVGQDYTLFLRQSADGSLVLPSQVAHIHSALVHFDPPLSYLLAGMNPGESRTFDGRMEVYSSKDPSVRWYGGRIRATTVYAGVYQVRTPAGAFRATLIRTEYRRTSSPAMSRTARLTFAVVRAQSLVPRRCRRGSSPPTYFATMPTWSVGTDSRSPAAYSRTM